MNFITKQSHISVVIVTEQTYLWNLIWTKLAVSIFEIFCMYKLHVQKQGQKYIDSPLSKYKIQGHEISQSALMY